MARSFNTADLSVYDFKLDEMGFKEETEKGIFFLDMMDALIGGRFNVLRMKKNNQKIIELAAKLPHFNGKEYFYYKDFDYDDFEWIDFDKTQYYNVVNIGELYEILITHCSVTAELHDDVKARDIYYNSILRMPEYFKYSDSKKYLEGLYRHSK